MNTCQWLDNDGYCMCINNIDKYCDLVNQDECNDKDCEYYYNKYEEYEQTEDKGLLDGCN